MVYNNVIALRDVLGFSAINVDFNCKFKKNSFDGCDMKK